MVDFNKRLLEEITKRRNLKENGIDSNHITHGLELLRCIRNSELGLTFEEGLVQENEWMTENKI